MSQKVIKNEKKIQKKRQWKKFAVTLRQEMTEISDESETDDNSNLIDNKTQFEQPSFVVFFPIFVFRVFAYCILLQPKKKQVANDGD